jgi:hypothetical protein
LKPPGFGGRGPIRSTCASFERSEPFGFSRFSVCSLTAGRSPPSESSSGAAIGAAASTEAVTADCQSSRSTSTTAVGREALPVEGKIAFATPAASETGSSPPTRIVLRVALAGKPSFAAAPESSDFTPSAGEESSSSPRLQPPARTAAASTAAGAARRGTAPSVAGLDRRQTR